MTAAPVQLAYTEWSLVELEGAPVVLGPGERPPTLALDLEESRLTGSGGVNRLAGTFALSEGELRFGPIATTLMAGPEDAMRRERAFLEALAHVSSYELEGRMLTLLAGGRVIARLAC